MPYKDEYHPRVKADLKRLDKEVVRELHGLHIGKILRDPQASEKLYGDLDIESNQVVYIVMVGKRENFYEILKRRLS